MKWHHEYDEDEEMLPRVLMIEYHRRNPAQIRKVTAREFKTLNELRTVYQEVCFRMSMRIRKGKKTARRKGWDGPNWLTSKMSVGCE